MEEHGTGLKTVVITGASRGIGEECAKLLGTRPRHLVLVARGKKDLARVAQEVQSGGGSAEYLQADLSTPARARRCAQQVLERVGEVDGLVLNAGTSNDRLVVRSELASVEYELGVNYLAPISLLMELLPGMLRRKRGAIVGVGSVTSLIPYPGNASYAASKAALFTFMRSLAIEVRPHGVHVGMVLPGLTRTRLTHGKSTLLPALGPQQVAAAVEKCLVQRAPMVVPGLDNKLMAALFRHFPMTLDRSVSLTARWLVPGYAQALADGRGL